MFKRFFVLFAKLTCAPGVQYGTRMGQNVQGLRGFPFAGAATTLSANGQNNGAVVQIALKSGLDSVVPDAPPAGEIRSPRSPTRKLYF